MTQMGNEGGAFDRRRRGPAADDPLGHDDLLLQAIESMADVPPERDLWPRIEARVAPRLGASRSFTFTLPQLAMAATLLIAVSAGVSWLAMRPAPATPEAAIRAVAEPTDAVQGDVQRATFADAAYDAAVADLEQVLRQGRDTLDPQTVMVLERNLAAIDDAIRQSRAALDADPANTYLNSHLADARRRKLELLRQAALLSNGGEM
ncbi:MAG: hypothetical protein AB7Q16_00915 [Vicinamibacterales bacterium]